MTVGCSVPSLKHLKDSTLESLASDQLFPWTRPFNRDGFDKIWPEKWAHPRGHWHHLKLGQAIKTWDITNPLCWAPGFFDPSLKFLGDNLAQDIPNAGKSLENPRVFAAKADSWDLLTCHPATGESNYDVRTCYCLDLLMLYDFTCFCILL